MAATTVEAVASRVIAERSAQQPDQLGMTVERSDTDEIVMTALHGDVEVDEHVATIRRIHAGQMDAAQVLQALATMPWWGHLALAGDDPLAAPSQQSAVRAVIRDAYALHQTR